MKIGYSLIDFDVVFPIQSSEFIKLLNFENKLKKAAKKPTIFQLKTDFYRFINIFYILNRVYCNSSQLDVSYETIRI